MKYFLFTLASATWVLLFAGCASFDKGVPQEVVVLSFPTHASLYVNGDAVGITPMKLNLPRKTTHEIRLEKQGYNPAVKYFTPVPNEKGTALIRFGLMEDLGYYYDLSPKTMRSKLQSGLVPTSTGADPFERMARQALEADRQLEAGEITPIEHKVIIEQIISFFESQS